MSWPQLSALKSVGWHPSSERFLGTVPPYLISIIPLVPIRSPGTPDTHCIFSLPCYASRNGLASLDMSVILPCVCFTSIPPTIQGLEWEWVSFLLSFAAFKPFLLPPPSKTQILWNIKPSPISLPCCIHPLMTASYGPTAFSSITAPGRFLSSFNIHKAIPKALTSQVLDLLYFSPFQPYTHMAVHCTL